jgi:hypothetical protein
MPARESRFAFYRFFPAVTPESPASHDFRNRLKKLPERGRWLPQTGGRTARKHLVAAGMLVIFIAGAARGADGAASQQF